MPEKLMPDEIQALKLTHRGKKTLVVKMADIYLQPVDMVRAVLCIPTLANKGFMTMERLNDDGDFIASVTHAGEAALKDTKNV